MKLGDWLREHTVMVVVEQADTVRTNQRTAILLACIEDVLFQFGALFRLLTKASGDDNESPHLLVLG